MGRNFVTTQQWDQERNRVTVYAFAIVNSVETLARCKVTRPCRLRTGMERYHCTIEIAATQNSRRIEAFGTAGGCGYDKIAGAIADAMGALGFDTRLVQGGRQYAGLALADGLKLNTAGFPWHIVRFE